MVSALADIRAYEDEALARLTEVREELARFNSLARDVPALENRLAELRAQAPDAPYRASSAKETELELEKARAARVERKRLRLEEASLLRQVEHTRRRFEENGIKKISLPMLENVTVAAPCEVSWADMQGDTDVRFCGECRQNVYNLSMMSREEAEAALVSAKESGMCVRLFRRDDGTVLTRDCPVGQGRQRRFWKRSRGIAAAGLLAAGIGYLAYEQLTAKCVSSDVTAGAMGTFSPN